MDIWELPTSLNVGGVDYKIRTDFRAILDILKTFDDPNFEEDEKWIVCLKILYEDAELIPWEYQEEALRKAVEFIDAGTSTEGNKQKPHTMDWEQDAQLIIPAVNKVLNKEIRAEKYLHWWTFLGAYMEIGECLFSEVVNIRVKKSKGKKLEKHEEQFYRENRELIDLKTKLSDEEQEKKDRLNAMLN